MKHRISHEIPSQLVRYLSFMGIALLCSSQKAPAQTSTWLGNGSDANWSTSGNWSITPTTQNLNLIFSGNGPTSTIEDIANPYPASITFTASAPAYTITLNPYVFLSIQGTGIVNNSSATQTFIITGGTAASPIGAGIQFSGTSALNLQLVNQGATDTSAYEGGTIQFSNGASAGTSTISNYAGSASAGAQTIFYDTSTASGSFITNYGATSTINTGQTAFQGNSTAATSTIINAGGTYSGGFGGTTNFRDNATAGSSIIINSTAASAYAGSGTTYFYNSSTAGSSTITAQGDSSGQDFGGGAIVFFDSSSAGSATLIAEGGANGGGAGNIQFSDTSSGGTARIILGAGTDNNSGGSLTIGNLTNGGTAVGSIEGGGRIFLGGNTLTTGSLNTSTEFSGVISDYAFESEPGNLTKVGTGTLVLSGSNTYAGTTTISTGTLQVGNGGTTGDISASSIVDNDTLIFNRSDVTATYALGISGTGTLTQNGTGALVLGGTNSYSGNTYINSGAIKLTSAGALSSNSNTQINGGVIEIGSSTAPTSFTLGTGAGQIQWTGNGGFSAAGGARSVTIAGGGLTWGAGNFVGAGATLLLGSADADNTLTLTNAINLGSSTRTVQVTRGSGTSDAALTGVISGAGGLNITGNGILKLGGASANTYSGGTTFSSGTVNLTTANDLGSAGNLTFSGGTMQFTSANKADYSARIFNSTSAINLDTNGQSVTFASALDSSNTGGLTKLGSGTLTLGGNNAYSGTTDLKAGTLAIGSNTALGTGTLLLDGGSFQNSNTTLRTLGNNITLAANTSFTGSGALTFNSGTLTNTGNFTLTDANSTASRPLTLNNINITNGSSAQTLSLADSSANGNIIINGTIADGGTGAGAISIVSLGTFTFNGNNTYTGGSYFQAPTVTVGSDSAFGTGLVTFNTGTLQGNGTAHTISSNISLTGGISVAGTSNLTFSGTIGQTAATGITVTNAATTTFNNTLSLSGFTVLPNSGQTAIVVLNGALSGTFNMSLNGANSGGGSTTTINGNNTGFSGTVDLFGNGTTNTPFLVLGNDNALGTATLKLDGGALKSDGNTRTLGNTLSLTFNSLVTGTGSFVFTGAMTNTSGANSSLTNNDSATVTFGAVNLSNSATSRTVTFGGTGTTIISGTIANGSTSTTGGLGKSGTGTLGLTGSANTYGGATTITGGTTTVAKLANGGTASSIGQSGSAATNLVISGGSLQYLGSGDSTDRLFQIGQTAAGGTATLDASGTGALSFTNTGTLGYGTTNQTRSLVLTGTSTAGNTFAPQITNNGTGATSLTKNGTGAWTLTGTDTYTGATTVNGGTLNVSGNGSINGTSRATINAGATFNYSSSTALTSATTINGGTLAYNSNAAYDVTKLTFTSGTLKGNGTLSGDLALSSKSQVISPGNSPGLLTLNGTQNWSATTYQWEINNFTGTNAGTDFDQIQINGALNLSATGNYLLDVTSLTSSETPGNVGNFTDGSESWLILDATSGITNFDSSKWTIDTSAFSSSSPADGTWNLVVAGSGNTNLVLQYNAVPEPSTFLLGGLGVLALGLHRRRRQGS